MHAPGEGGGGEVTSSQFTTTPHSWCPTDHIIVLTTLLTGVAKNHDYCRYPYRTDCIYNHIMNMIFIY